MSLSSLCHRGLIRLILSPTIPINMTIIFNITKSNVAYNYISYVMLTLVTLCQKFKTRIAINPYIHNFLFWCVPFYISPRFPMHPSKLRHMLIWPQLPPPPGWICLQLLLRKSLQDFCSRNMFGERPNFHEHESLNLRLMLVCYGNFCQTFSAPAYGCGGTCEPYNYKEIVVSDLSMGLRCFNAPSVLLGNHTRILKN